MKRAIIIFLAASSAIMTLACKEVSSEIEQINSQALQEYSQPIRPGYDGKQPYWNKFSEKFIYAPAFDFKEYEGAAAYRFTAYLESQNFENMMFQVQGTDENFYLPRHIPANAPSWSFIAKKPTSALSEIWNQLPQGYIDLIVEAIDKDGNALSTVGTRRFLRDFPFVAPGAHASRDYFEAAMLALKFVHESDLLKDWRYSNEINLEHDINSYACKIIGSDIQLETLVARYFPEYREEALTAARNAADFLIRNAFPENSSLAHFPPTYYGMGKEASRQENQVTTMTMEALYPAIGYLDLYDQVKEKKYLDEAISIADTYVALQQEDGSIPRKIYFATGEPVIGGAIPFRLLSFVKRLKTQYGIDKYGEFILKCEKWMEDGPMKTLDFTPQFEDVSVTGWEPFEDFTCCTSATYVSYLLGDGTPRTKEVVSTCKDILALCEDQLTLWDNLANADGGKAMSTPCVMEQFSFRVPIDASATIMANAWLDYYKVTGDKLALAKSLAMVNGITIAQRPETGFIPTVWVHDQADASGFWTNCIAESIRTLLRFHEQLSPAPKAEEYAHRIIVAGDRSATGYFTSVPEGSAGWGTLLQEFVNDSVKVVSFPQEQEALDCVQENDVVIVQPCCFKGDVKAFEEKVRSRNAYPIVLTLPDCGCAAAEMVADVLSRTERASSWIKSDKTADFSDYDVYLAIGNSDMTGKGKMHFGDLRPVEGVALLNTEGVPVAANNPFNQYSSVKGTLSSQMLSPAYSFAQSMYQKTGRKVLMVVNASDTQDLKDWQKSGLLFNEAVRRATQAKKYGHIKGIIWFGSDASSSQSIEFYNNLNDFVVPLREALGEKQIPFIASYMPYWLEESERINYFIRVNVKKTRYASSVSSEWLMGGSNFDRYSNVILGERYAEAMLEMSYLSIGTPDKLF